MLGADIPYAGSRVRCADVADGTASYSVSQRGGGGAVCGSEWLRAGDNEAPDPGYAPTSSRCTLLLMPCYGATTYTCSTTAPCCWC
eukprot:641357-Rhodomonas_salina.4